MLQKYEDQIESLQKQVMEQSMTMSMMSSMTPDEFHNDEDVFGKAPCIHFKRATQTRLCVCSQ